jgi:hypothetical protein
VVLIGSIGEVRLWPIARFRENEEARCASRTRSEDFDKNVAGNTLKEPQSGWVASDVSRFVQAKTSGICKMLEARGPNHRNVAIVNDLFASKSVGIAPAEPLKTRNDVTQIRSGNDEMSVRIEHRST